jgi:hypothetical protein
MTKYRDIRAVEAERNAALEKLKRAIDRPAVQEFGNRALLITRTVMLRYQAAGEFEKAEAVKAVLDNLSLMVLP